MLYKLFPLDTEPRRCIVVGEESPEIPMHTPASLAEAVRAWFPDMTVYEPAGKPFIVVQANLPVPSRLGRNTAERQGQLGGAAIEAICRNANCRAEPVAGYRELTKREKVRLLRRYGFSAMAQALEKDTTR